MRLVRRSGGIPGVPARPEPRPEEGALEYKELSLRRERVQLSPLFYAALPAPELPPGEAAASRSAGQGPGGLAMWLDHRHISTPTAGSIRSRRHTAAAGRLLDACLPLHLHQAWTPNLPLSRLPSCGALSPVPETMCVTDACDCRTFHTQALAASCPSARTAACAPRLGRWATCASPASAATRRRR